MDNPLVVNEPVVQNIKLPGSPQPAPVAPVPEVTPQPEPQPAPEGPVASPEPSNEPDPTQEPVSHPDDLQAAHERLKQQMSRNNKLLSSLGLDPTSDLGEQLEAGVITEDMVRSHIQNRLGFTPQPAPAPGQPGPVPQSNNPVDTAQQNLASIREQYNNEAAEGSVSLETNNALLEAIQTLNDAKLEDVRNQFTADSNRRAADETVDRVLNVARSMDGYEQMEQPLQQTVDTAMIAVTGVVADREAVRLGLDPARLTPQQVEYFAQKANDQLAMLANHFIGVGEQRVKAGLRPANPNVNRPVPAGSGGNPVVPGNPFVNANLSNHKDLVRNFMASQQQV